MPSGGDEAGFTLVELLIVCVLMLLIMGATLTSFEAFQRNTKVNERQNDAQDMARRGLDLMARDLRNLASPTPELPEAVQRAQPQDVIFQSEGKTKPAGSLNAQNTVRMRYCLDPAAGQLWREIQTWTTATPPGTPADTACPGTGWATRMLVADHVVNDGRPMFTYNATELTSVTEVSSQLWVDVNPGKSPTEVDLQTSVFLRNQNRAPTAVYSWAPAANSAVFLNASESTDPEEKALQYWWYDPMVSTTTPVGEGIIFTYTPPSPGPRDMYLVVEDATLKTRAPTQTVCAAGPGVTCP
jgi:type II secretory pathway pseudopilin PulG